MGDKSLASFLEESGTDARIRIDNVIGVRKIDINVKFRNFLDNVEKI